MQTLSEKQITAIILVHQRWELLRRAIDSIEKYGAKTSDWECLFVLNGASADIEQKLYQRLHESILPWKICRIEAARPGFARVQAAKVANSPLLLFLDDDIELFQDVIGAAKKLFQDQKLQAAGGSNLTPPDSPVLARASGYVMESFWGALGMRARYQRINKARTGSEHNLILCNLCVRKSIFLRHAIPKALVSNEENILLQKISDSGGALVQSPDLAVYHHRRSTWSTLFQQNYKYGNGRAQNILYLPKSAAFYYFLPSLFLFLVALTGYWSIYFLSIHAVISFIFIIPNLIAGDLRAAFLQIPVYLLTHLAYGLGFLQGFLRWSWSRGKLCETN